MSDTRRTWTIVALVAAVTLLFGSMAAAIAVADSDRAITTIRMVGGAPGHGGGLPDGDRGPHRWQHEDGTGGPGFRCFDDGRIEVRPGQPGDGPSPRPGRSSGGD